MRLPSPEAWRAVPPTLHHPSALPPFLQQVFQETGAGIFEQVKHPFESVITPVVGVGHLGGAESAAMVGQGADSAPTRRLALQSLHSGQVVGIHGEDVVEAMQIGGLDLPSLARKVDTAAFGGGDHAAIGPMAHVPAARAG